MKFKWGDGQSNSHNLYFWTMLYMPWKKKSKEREFKCYWLSWFALNFSFADAKIHIYGHFTGAEENYFFSINSKQMRIGNGICITIGKSNQHELVTKWSWYLFLHILNILNWPVHPKFQWWSCQFKIFYFSMKFKWGDPVKWS